MIQLSLQLINNKMPEQINPPIAESAAYISLKAFN